MRQAVHRHLSSMLFQSLSKPGGWMLPVPFFCRWGNWGTETWHDICKVSCSSAANRNPDLNSCDSTPSRPVIPHQGAPGCHPMDTLTAVTWGPVLPWRRRGTIFEHSWCPAVAEAPSFLLLSLPALTPPLSIIRRLMTLKRKERWKWVTSAYANYRCLIVKPLAFVSDF